LHLQEQDAKTFDVLEKLWVRLLKSSAIDKHEALMAFIVTIKWVGFIFGLHLFYLLSHLGTIFSLLVYWSYIMLLIYC
jgi:hypothetical protein